jgi:NTP pyrophosphatase (non-canonical NTP hydrolase)
MFAIGDKEWPGISKLVEESGEVQQIIGKLMGTRGKTEHWNVADLKSALEDEMADLSAAIEFVSVLNDFDMAKFYARAQTKLLLFYKWQSDNPEPVFENVQKAQD